MLMETIGQRIKKYREVQGISQERLAQMLRITRESVSQWESDGPKATQPRPQKYGQIAAALNITYEMLVVGEVPAKARGPVTPIRSR